MENIRLSHISIDSLRFLIPLESVEILDKELNGRVMLVSLDGEVKGDQADAPLVRYVRGVKVEYRVVNPSWGFGTRKRCIQLLINSKMLGGRYFEGITLDTVKLLHGEILNHGVVNFSLDTLLRARCLDVDFKLDTRCDFKALVAVLNKHTKETVEALVNHRDGQTHRGLYFNNRDGGKGAKYPYWKVYDKAYQMFFDDTDFLYRHFALNGDLEAARQTIKGLVRIEYTVPNTAAFKRYGVESSELGLLLSLSDEVKLKMLVKVMGKYLNLKIMREAKEVTKGVGEVRLTPKDWLEIRSVRMLLEKYEGKDQAINYECIEFAKANGLEVTDKRVRETRRYYREVFSRHWDYLEMEAKELVEKSNDLEIVSRAILGDRIEDLDLFAFL